MKKSAIGLLLATTLLLAISSSLATPPPPTNYRICTPYPAHQNEETVRVCPTDSNVVIAMWRDLRLGPRRIGIGRSTDAGNSWTDSLVRLVRFDYQSDPSLEVDREGNFFACFVDFDVDYHSTYFY